MAQIEVRPQDLESRAQALRNYANSIKKSVAVVDQQILVRMNQANFSGNRPDALRNRYNQMKQSLQFFDDLVTNFATKLEEAARDFRAADKV
jgi:type VII secretion effector (TIGR04197 family)